jgi:N-dimethylarginine dimethylaminohydrolase
MKKILMCDPQFFGVTYDINPWMSANIGKVDQKIATHNGLYCEMLSRP